MDLDNKPTIWLVSWNPKRTPDFDLDEVFANNDVTDWWKVPAMKSAKVGGYSLSLCQCTADGDSV